MPFANVNGVNLYYEEYGEGEPVVFIHGIAITSRVWSFQKEAISARYRMIVYDLRGSGESGSTPDVLHTAELLCEDLKGLLEHLNIQRAHIVAVSLGAAVAMKFAIKYPDRVNRLVITGAFADLNGILGFVSRHFASVIGGMLMTRLFGGLATKIMLPSAPRHELRDYHRNIIRIDRQDVIKYRQVLNSYSITPALNRIKAPTLILYGSREKFLHKQGRLIHRLIKDSCMRIITGVGHGWNGENSGLFNRIVMDFLSCNVITQNS